MLLSNQGLSCSAIQKELRKDNVSVSVVGIWKFLQRYEKFGSTKRQPGLGHSSTAGPEIEATIESAMQNDNETTASELKVLLTAKGCSLSLATIKRCRSRIGWTFRGSAYCQLIRKVKKEKRLVWARANLTATLTDGFTNVIWTDKTPVQLESHRRHSFKNKRCPPKPKPR